MEDNKSIAVEQGQYDDVFITIVRKSNEAREAEEQARFRTAMQCEAAKYRQHKKEVRRRFRVLNQVSLVLSGVLGFMTAIQCMHGGGWWSLAGIVATSAVWGFSLWCNRQSR